MSHDTPEPIPGLSGTYSPEDNKLRLTSAGRLDADIYAQVKAAGFRWAPRQQIFVAPAWTPARADLLAELCGDIDDEDSTLTERAEERANRFTDYQGKRTADAEAAQATVDRIADNIPLGQPILVGHHSERHARKDAERIRNGMRKAVRLWDTAAYWKRRAAAALRHADHKQRPGVRARRIKRLEADERKQQRNRDEAAHWLKLWSRDGLTVDQARAIAARCWLHLPHKEGDRPDWNQCPTAYGMIEESQHPELYAPRTLAEVIAAALAHYPAVIAHCDRWLDHIRHRLTYERALLTDAGGTAADRSDLQPGGRVLIGRDWLTVVRVNKSAGQVVSVTTNARYCRVRGVETVKDYKPPTEDTAAAVKQAVKLPPLVNYPGDGFRPVTRQQWKQKTADYKSTRHEPATAEHGAHRQRYMMTSGYELVPVYITDAKLKDRPPAPIEPDDPGPTVPPPTPDTAAHNRRNETEAREQEAEQTPHRQKLDAMRATLRAGVQTVTAPGLFPTPPDLARRMVLAAGPGSMAGLRVLEPSAGTGNIIRAIINAATGADCVQVVAVEINDQLAARLQTQREKTLYATSANFDIRRADFLTLNGDLGTFDRVIMNPPFTRGADIAHIRHALTFLKPGGRLVALCANGPRQNRDLRPLVDEWHDLPAGTFKESGTNVSAALIVANR